MCSKPNFAQLKLLRKAKVAQKLPNAILGTGLILVILYPSPPGRAGHLSHPIQTGHSSYPIQICRPVHPQPRSQAFSSTSRSVGTGRREPWE